MPRTAKRRSRAGSAPITARPVSRKIEACRVRLGRGAEGGCNQRDRCRCGAGPFWQHTLHELDCHPPSRGMPTVVRSRPAGIVIPTPLAGDSELATISSATLAIEVSRVSPRCRRQLDQLRNEAEFEVINFNNGLGANDVPTDIFPTCEVRAMQTAASPPSESVAQPASGNGHRPIASQRPARCRAPWVAQHRRQASQKPRRPTGERSGRMRDSGSCRASCRSTRARWAATPSPSRRAADSGSTRAGELASEGGSNGRTRPGRS